MKTSVLLVALLLAGLPGRALALSEVEPNNTPESANQIVSGERVDARISASSDRDCYALVLPAGGKITLVAGQTMGDANGLLFSLADAYAGVVTVATLDSFEGRVFIATLPAGRYVLTVSNRTGTAGSYWFRCDLAPAHPRPVPLVALPGDTTLPDWWRQLPSAAGVADSQPPVFDAASLPLNSATAQFFAPDGVVLGPVVMAAHDYPAGLPAFIDLSDTFGRVLARWRLEEDSRADNRVQLRTTAGVIIPELRAPLPAGDYRLQCYAGDYAMRELQGRELRLRRETAGALPPAGSGWTQVVADNGVWWFLEKVAQVMDTGLNLPEPQY